MRLASLAYTGSDGRKIALTKYRFFKNLIFSNIDFSKISYLKYAFFENLIFSNIDFSKNAYFKYQFFENLIFQKIDFPRNFLKEVADVFEWEALKFPKFSFPALEDRYKRKKSFASAIHHRGG